MRETTFWGLLTKKEQRLAVVGGGVILGLVVCAFAVLFVVPYVEEPVARSTADYGWLKTEEIVLTATGTAGTAEGTGVTDRDLHGRLYALHLDYTPTISTTTDVTLTLAAPPLTVLTLTNYFTDTWYYPIAEQTFSDGNGASAYTRLPVGDAVDIAVGQTASDTHVLTVTVYWGE